MHVYVCIHLSICLSIYIYLVNYRAQWATLGQIGPA